MSPRRLGSLLLCSLLPLATSSLLAQTQPQAAQQQPNTNRPTLFVVGDLPFASIQGAFDPNMIKLVESPAPDQIKGQTTRTYLNSGTWDQLTAQMKSGDFVLIGFNPNTNVSLDKLSTDPNAAATQTLNGGGDSIFDYLDPATHKHELVHNYAWYLRKLVVDTINHGASPILCYPPVPPDPANQFPNNPKLAYPAWIISSIATEQHIPFLDMTTQPIRPALESLKPDPLGPFLAEPK